MGPDPHTLPANDTKTRFLVPKILLLREHFFDDNEVLKARLKQKIKSGEVHKFISDLVSENPLIVVAIDQRTEELDEALRHIGREVQVVEFRTFRREGLSDNVNAFAFEPVFSESPVSIVDTGNETDRKGRGTDRFGSRLGSKKAKINAVLSKEAKTMKRLVEEAGLSGEQYGHLNRLIKKGFVRKTGEGFKVLGETVGPSRKKQTIGSAMFELFGEKGVDNVTYAECESRAKQVKPDTKFNKSHFSRYKNKYKQTRSDGSPGEFKLSNATCSTGQGTDRFGSRLGSNKAKINAVLSKTPKTMTMLMKEAGVPSAYYQHLNRLIEKGFVEKTGKGFKVLVELSDHPRKKQTIESAILELFDNRGIDNVTYDECVNEARRVKPDTKFNRTYFSYYRNKYKRRNKHSGELSVGLKLKNVYKGIEFKAEVVEGGKVRFRGHKYNSLSKAAIAAIQSTGSKREAENGWMWWKFVDPKTGEERAVGALRK